MKYQQTPAFVGDWRHLSSREKRLFLAAIPKFIDAAERSVDDPAAAWPSALRVKDVEGAAGVWEMTWSFSGPDGRATWEWVNIDGQAGIRWRRIGNHKIFRQP